MRDFVLVLGIDCSGAEAPNARLKGLQVYTAQPGGVPQKRFSPAPGLRVSDASGLRLCERRTSSAKSVFHFDVQGSVAKSTHAGIPWLKRLRNEAGERVHFWPFDGWVPADGQ